MVAGAEPERVMREIEEVVGIDCSYAIRASAKQVCVPAAGPYQILGQRDRRNAVHGFCCQPERRLHQACCAAFHLGGMSDDRGLSLGMKGDSLGTAELRSKVRPSCRASASMRFWRPW